MRSSNTSFSAGTADSAVTCGRHRTIRVSMALLFQALVLTIMMSGLASASEGCAQDCNRFRVLIEQQRAAGRYDSALEMALELQQLIAGSPDARPWESGDAAREIATLTAILAMPPEARAEVTEADRLEDSVRQHIRNRDFATGVTLAERQL
ncbi:MAG: hypothetical protein KAY24_17235, partial [Candidatus Eisenbacteria sp.]|nr:hypothetical protein [Candidatus Eisenbacteria bacterium]